MIESRRFTEVEEEFGLDSSIIDTVAANLGCRREHLIVSYDEDNGLPRLSESDLVWEGETSTGVLVSLYTGPYDGKEAVNMELLTEAPIPTFDNVYFTS
jgi:hypothetical protein